ncbi:MAG TPA: fatty acid desaturase family protein [Acidimicrobiia bacterium]|nr:fatty acid desaturase family protein [Acidimicrobiia bacterium]
MAGRVVDGRRLGGMVPSAELRAPIAATELIRDDGRPQPVFRDDLRRIPSWRNAWSVAFVWIQTVGIVALAVWWGNPIGYVLAFLLMGRACAQLASLMHESAHRLLFANRTANDLVGRWLCGYPIFTSTDAYRRVHMAHHRHEFGPDEPDIPLYADYPISGPSFRRKLVRDATGQTGYKLFRDQARGFRSDNPRTRHTLWQILVVQAVLLGAAIAVGRWWLYPLLWVLPYLTVWRVINRLRSIAEHGGMDESPDRRATTHSVRQHAVARTFLVPYRIGWHLAHHVDAGIPMRALPRYHQALVDAGYVVPALEFRSYPALWQALRGVGPVPGPEPSGD